MKKLPKKYTRTRRQEGAEEGSVFLRSALGTLLLTLALGGGTLLLSSLILTFCPDPLSLALPAGYDFKADYECKWLNICSNMA